MSYFKKRLRQIVSWWTIRFKNFNLHLSQQLILKIQLQQNAWIVNSKKKNNANKIFRLKSWPTSVQLEDFGWGLSSHSDHFRYIHSSFYSSFHSFIHPFIHPFIHSFILLFTLSFIHSSFYSSFHPFFHLFIHPSFYSFTLSFLLLFTIFFIYLDEPIVFHYLTINFFIIIFILSKFLSFVLIK